MKVRGRPDEQFSCVNPVNQYRDPRWFVGIFASILYGAGFEASATPEGLYFLTDDMIGSPVKRFPLLMRL